MASSPGALSSFDDFMADRQKPKQVPAQPQDLSFDSFMQQRSAAPPTEAPVPLQPAGLPHPDEVDRVTTGFAQTAADHLTRAAMPDTGQSIGPAPTHWYDRLLAPVIGPGSAFGDGALGSGQDRSTGERPILDPDKPLINFSANDKNVDGPAPVRGITKGIQTGLSGLTTPKNAALLIATYGAGSLPVIGRLISAGFAGDMLYSAGKRSPELVKQIKSGDAEGAAKTATEMGLNVGMAALGAKHALGDGAPAPVASAEPALEYNSAGQPTRQPSAEVTAGSTGTEPYRPADLNFDTFMNGRTAPQEKPNVQTETHTQPEPPQVAPSGSGEPPARAEAEPAPVTLHASQESVPGPTEVPSTEPGVTATVRTPVGTKAHVRYRIDEAKDLVTSFDGDRHNASFQPRNTDRIGSRQRVEQRKADMDPEAMGYSRMAGDGAPITSNRMAVTRNHGLQALKEIYAEERPLAQTYRGWVGENAGLAGKTPEQVNAMNQPILHRELSENWDPDRIARFAREANTSSTARMSDAEIAEQMARKLNGATMDAFQPNDDGIPNPEFVRGLIRDLPVEEQAVFFDKNGEISQSGARLVRNAVFAKAYPNRSAIERMSEATDSNVRNITNGMLRSANDVAKLQEAIDRGDRYPLSISHDIGTAAAVIDDLRTSKKSVDDWLNQEHFGGRDPVLDELVTIFSDEARRPKVIADTIRNYTRGVDQAGSPNQHSMFASESPTKIELLKESYESAKRTAEQQVAARKRGSAQQTLSGDQPGNAAEGPQPDGGSYSSPGAAPDVSNANSEAVSAPLESRNRSGERGSIDPELLTLGTGKFIEHDVAPVLRDVAAGIRDTSDDILKVLAPTLRSRQAQQASLILRNRIAELARKSDQAQAALRAASKYFAKQPAAENFEFIDRVESGAAQKNADLDQIAATLRTLLDSKRADVQALGTGKLQSFYENYFPHIWKRPERARSLFDAFFGKRPLEGGKSFLKQRKLPTIADGRAAGLEPVTDNPVDLVLLKVHEMDRYVMAHTTLADWKGSGLARFVDARTGQPPAGWTKIDDPIGAIYGQSVQQIAEYPNEGLWSGLGKVADAIGIEHERGFKNLRGAVGRARQGEGNRVQTLHGSAEDVLAHEIGHQIDWLAGSGKRFILEYPDATTVGRLKTAYATLKDSASTLDQRRDARAELASLKDAIANRKEFAKQLRDLADLRSGEKSYTRKREEKMAQLAEMWVGSREQFQRTAPRVFEEWKKFLDENPKLHALRDIEGNTEVTPISQPYDVGGLVIKGHWYAPEGASRLLNNYLSPGLRRYGSYRVALGLNNVLNQFQLGMSAFHLGFTAADTTVSKVALGFQALMRGKPLAAAKFFAETPTAAFTTFMKGDKMLKEWYRPGSQGAAIGSLVDNLVVAGGRARMDQMYRTQIADHMQAALRQGNLIGAALRAPFAGVEWTSNLIMNEVVPRMKLGAFADMARFHLEQLGPDATFEDARRVLTQDWNSVENRLGEMTYDNLFWNKTAKDLAMLTTRSVGWNLGTLREIGGGIADTVVQPMNALQGKPVNLNRLSYLLGLVTINASMSAIYQYAKTGKGPDELKDYFFPKNGEIDEQGHPQRVSWPTYVKDVYHYATHPLTTLEGKIAPIWSAFGEMVHNRDFFGTEIRHAEDPLVKQLEDLAKFAGEQFEPIGVRNYQRESKLGASTETKAEQFFGMSPAPSDLNQSPAERMAHAIAAAHMDGEPRTKEAAARRELKQSLARSLRGGKGIPADVLEARRNGTLSKRDVEDAFRASKETPLQQSFTHLGVDDAVKVYAAADAGEKKTLRPMLLKKARTSMESEPPVKRKQTLEKLRTALAAR